MEAISVGEDAAPEPRVHGADFGQEEEAPTQVVMGRLLNRDSAWASEPLHRGWEVRAAEGAVQDDPVGGPERPLGTGGHCTRIKKVGRKGGSAPLQTLSQHNRPARLGAPGNRHRKVHFFVFSPRRSPLPLSAWHLEVLKMDAQSLQPPSVLGLVFPFTRPSLREDPH